VADARLEDYLDLAFEALPQKVKQSTVKMIYYVTKIEFLSQILTSDTSETEIAQLRQRFAMKAMGTLFIPIPVNGVNDYMEGIQVRCLPTFLAIY
jgi:hypothetical protein